MTVYGNTCLQYSCLNSMKLTVVFSIPQLRTERTLILVKCTKSKIKTNTNCVSGKVDFVWTRKSSEEIYEHIPTARVIAEK